MAYDPALNTKNKPQQVSDARHEDGPLSPTEAAMQYFTEYARQKPEVVALWALGIGFVLGWKLKPW